MPGEQRWDSAGGSVDERVLQDSVATEALVLRDAAGAVYAVPKELLAQCRLATETEQEVQGYLNPQPIPPGRMQGQFESLGFVPVRLGQPINPAQRQEIIFVGGRL